MGARIFLTRLAALLCGGTMLVFPPRASAEVLTEAEVIRLARTNDLEAAEARAAAAMAEANAVGASLYPNPTLSWNRRDIPDVEREDAVFATAPIDLSGRRAAQAGLARANAASATATARQAKSEAVVRALGLFHEARASAARGAIRAEVTRQIEEAAEVVARRREEGTASGYDEARLVIAGELSRSETNEARARGHRLLAELAARIGLDPRAKLELPPLGRSDGSAADVTRDEHPPRAAHPSLRSLGRAVEEARDAKEAAETAWVPTLNLSGGWALLAEDQTEHGYTAGLSVAVPLTARGQGLEAQAEARTRHALAAERSAEREVEIARSSSARALSAARAELDRFTQAVDGKVETLLRAAASSYREGRGTIVELVDATQTWAALEERRLHLLLELEQAKVAYRAARGEFE